MQHGSSGPRSLGRLIQCAVPPLGAPCTCHAHRRQRAAVVLVVRRQMLTGCAGCPMGWDGTGTAGDRGGRSRHRPATATARRQPSRNKQLSKTSSSSTSSSSRAVAAAERQAGRRRRALVDRGAGAAWADSHCGHVATMTVARATGHGESGGARQRQWMGTHKATFAYGGNSLVHGPTHMLP